jgi:hypothetical protein
MLPLVRYRGALEKYGFLAEQGLCSPLCQYPAGSKCTILKCHPLAKPRGGEAQDEMPEWLSESCFTDLSNNLDHFLFERLRIS